MFHCEFEKIVTQRYYIGMMSGVSAKSVRVVFFTRGLTWTGTDKSAESAKYVSTGCSEA